MPEPNVLRARAALEAPEAELLRQWRRVRLGRGHGGGGGAAGEVGGRGEGGRRRRHAHAPRVAVVAACAAPASCSFCELAVTRDAGGEGGSGARALLRGRVGGRGFVSSGRALSPPMAHGIGAAWAVDSATSAL